MGIVKIAIDMLKDAEPEMISDDIERNAKNDGNNPFEIRTITEGFSLHNSDKGNSQND